MTRVQVETELDTNLLSGEIIVRVKYRPAGSRRWTKLIVVPDDGQSPQELLRQGHEIAAAHMARLAEPKEPRQEVGALARAAAMQAGHPEWWKVTQWPLEPYVEPKEPQQ